MLPDRIKKRIPKPVKAVYRALSYDKTRILGPKMTPRASEFITKYRALLNDGMHDADLYLDRHAGTNMVEFLKSSKRFMEDVAERQDTEHDEEMDLYLPIHTMLYMLGRKIKPEKVVETGVEKGGSTYMLLKSLHANGMGHLWSIDREMYYSYEGRLVALMGPLVTDDLKARWSFILGNAQKILGGILQRTGNLDAFMALQGHTYEVQKHEGDTAWPCIKSGGIFMLDRPDWNDGKYLKEFLETHGSEVVHHETYNEGSASDPFEFTVIIKK